MLETLSIKVAMTYSPTNLCSTIGAVGLNFSVRDGKRWIPNAINRLNKWPINDTSSTKKVVNHYAKQTISKKTDAILVQKTLIAEPGDIVQFLAPPLLNRGHKKSSRAISTARLNTLLCLHLQPINVVVYNDPQGKSNLVVGFALRCFQRLSRPDADTQRCSWRNNW